MTLPDTYFGEALASVAAAAVLSLGLLWGSERRRQFMGDDNSREAFLWGAVIVGPLLTRIVDPLVHALMTGVAR